MKYPWFFAVLWIMYKIGRCFCCFILSESTNHFQFGLQRNSRQGKLVFWKKRKHNSFQGILEGLYTAVHILFLNKKRGCNWIIWHCWLYKNMKQKYWFKNSLKERIQTLTGVLYYIFKGTWTVYWGKLRFGTFVLASRKVLFVLLILHHAHFNWIGC